MFKNNVSLAWRSLQKDMGYTLTNLVGLTIGITCSLLILSFVKYELSFDQFHSKKDQIYRVNYDVLMGGNQIISPAVPVFVAPELKKRFPEIEDVTRFRHEWHANTVRSKDIFFDEKNFGYADPNFFRVFDFKAISGHLATALDKPNTLVITKTMAGKYFGNSDPIGQTLIFNNKNNYTITAVIEDIPGNSHLSFDLLTSLYSMSKFDSAEMKIQWDNPDYATYLVLKPQTKGANLETKIDQWVNPPQKDGSPASQNSHHLRLEPLKQVHFNTQVFNFQNQLSISDFRYIRIFISVAALVLLIGCANYINLATAKASVRAKEVAVRKTVGASFSQLFFQFLTESFLLVLPAIILSIVAVSALLPYMNTLLGKKIPFYILDRNFLLCIVAGWILVSLIAGFYPSIVLSKYRPVETLKGAFAKTGRSGMTVRKSLVVFQFSISVILILGTLIVRSQLEYMQSKKLGLEKDHVVIIKGNSDLYKNLDAFANDLRKIKGIRDVSQTWRSPFETVIGNGFSIKEKPTRDDDWHVVGGIAGDQHYLSTLDISLLAGRDFDPVKIKGDSTVNEFIVNEAFLQHYQLKPEDVLGKKVILGLVGTGPIVGVVKDFHIGSLHSKIEPVVIFNHPNYYGSVLVKIAPGKMEPVLDRVAQVWKGFVPMRPLNYSFLDEEYGAMYRTEQRLGTLMSVFCSLAILITCLGLLGLAAFTIAQRTKEIGIRKVLGASVSNIATMISTDFVQLVLVALVIAFPLSWWAMNKWLQDFAYRIHISWWLFAGAGILALFIAMVTVSYQSIKAAMANPVKSLRTE